MKKSLLCAFLCLTGFLAIAAPARAMRLGAFEIHPFIDVSEEYTDNVFASNTNKEGDFATVITPGIQLIYPRAEKRYRLELLYQATIEHFYRFSSENAVTHKAIGKFHYRMPSGFDLNIGDEFTRGHDIRGINVNEELDFYRDNLLSVSLGYSLSERFGIRADYRYYILRYDADRNSFRNRHDNTLAGYLFYKVMPKTSVFVEYEYTDVEFDESSDMNSKEHHFFAGITWDVTGKTKGTVKAGFEKKVFEDPSISGFQGYIMEVDIDHNFDSRNSLRVVGVRKTNETNIAGADFFVTTGLLLEYYHRFTGKISGKAYVGYERDEYRGGFSRKDDVWKAGASLSYQIRKWLRTEAGYSYTIRNSTIDDFDYTNNMYFLRIGATL